MHLVYPPTHPPSQILHNHCLGFLLGQLLYPGEIGNNGYAKFGGWGVGGGGGVNKKHYGLCESSELKKDYKGDREGIPHIHLIP